MRIWSVVSNGGLECPSSTSTTCDHAFTLTRRKTAVSMMSRIDLFFDTAYPSPTAASVGRRGSRSGPLVGLDDFRHHEAHRVAQCSASRGERRDNVRRAIALRRHYTCSVDRYNARI